MSHLKPKFENILSASNLSDDDKDWLRSIFAQAEKAASPAPTPTLALNEAQYMLLREQWAISLAGASSATSPYDAKTAGKVVDTILERLLPMLRTYGHGQHSLADLAASSALNQDALDVLASWPDWKRELLCNPDGLVLAAANQSEENLIGVVVGDMKGKLSFNVAALDPSIPAGTKLYADFSRMAR